MMKRRVMSSVTIDEGKAKARAIVLEGIVVNTWLMICHSFDDKSWKVNLINLNLQCC
jgi:hypothetical protein